MGWSQNFTVKSNARRAAKKAGIDVAEVTAWKKAGKKVYRFPMPDTNGLRNMIENEKKAAKKTRAIARMKKVQAATDARIKKGLAERKAAKKAKAPKAKANISKVMPGTGGFGLAVPRAAAKAARAAKAATPKADASKADRGLKFIAVAALLRRAGGASITEVCAATGWLPHSARARISVDVAKLLVHGEEIVRRREEGVSHYSIVKSRQLDLPIGEAA
jgi:Protein of unknown function (DUF3489)